MFLLLNLRLNLCLPSLWTQFNHRHFGECGRGQFARYELGDPVGGILVELDTPTTVMVPEGYICPRNFNTLLRTITDTPLEKSDF